MTKRCKNYYRSHVDPEYIMRQDKVLKTKQTNKYILRKNTRSEYFQIETHRRDAAEHTY